MQKKYNWVWINVQLDLQHLEQLTFSHFTAFNTFPLYALLLYCQSRLVLLAGMDCFEQPRMRYQQCVEVETGNIKIC